MSDPDQNAAGSGFGRFVPGFEFLQNLASQAAGGLAQGMGKAAPQLPSLGSWVAPTFNVEDLEKRIEELKAVHFWLDQNSKALAATIQALEVQKMTLATLKTMNLSMGDVANSLKVQVSEAMAGFAGAASAASGAGTTPTPGATTQFAGLEIPPRTYGNPASPPAAPEPAPASSSADEAASAGAAAPAPAAAGVIDPMQWWGALSQQFQQIASQALQDAARRATPPADDTPPPPAAAPAPAAASAAPSPAPEAAPAPAPRKKAASRRRPAAPAQALPGGDWPMPSAFFQLPGFPDMTPAPAKKPARTATAKPADTAAPKSTAKKPAARTSAAKQPVARKAAAKSSSAKKAAPATRRR